MPRQRSRLTGPTRPRSRPYLHCPTGASEGRGTPSRADEPGAARYPSRSNRRHVQRILARLLGYAAGLPQVANETLEPRPVADSDSHRSSPIPCLQLLDQTLTGAVRGDPETLETHDGRGAGAVGARNVGLARNPLLALRAERPTRPHSGGFSASGTHCGTCTSISATRRSSTTCSRSCEPGSASPLPILRAESLSQFPESPRKDAARLELLDLYLQVWRVTHPGVDVLLAPDGNV